MGGDRRKNTRVQDARCKMQDGRGLEDRAGEKLERACPQIHNTKKSYILTVNQFTLLFTIRCTLSHIGSRQGQGGYWQRSAYL